MSQNTQDGFSARLKQALSRTGVSQADLAARMGVSRALVNHWVQGRQQPADNQLARIAEALSVSRNWFQAETAIEPSRRPTPPSNTGADFYWRRQPEDGGRDFGNSNAYATPTDVQTFVRESAQNSKDQADPDTEVHIRYRVIELTRGSAPFEAFMNASGLRGSLREHLESATKTPAKLASRLREGLRMLDEEDKLVLVRVDDYGTSGLFGNESGDNGGPFAALVRDNLNSSKMISTATGSYGVGKAVLWRSSAISAVFISSQLDKKHETPESQGKVRAVGKAELSWHQGSNSDGPFAGPGWFGSQPHGNSLWLEPDDQLLRNLQLDRHDAPSGVAASHMSGTSILVVGFRDLSAKEEATHPLDLARDLANQAARNFWPRILQGKLKMSVEYHVDGVLKEMLAVQPEEYVPEFCDAYRALLENEVIDWQSEKRPSIEPGDVVRLTIDAPIPATSPVVAKSMQCHEKITSQATLLVRLARPDDETEKDMLHRVALFRGGGLVVNYWSRAEIVVGGRPFHAILLTGEAVGRDTAQQMAEQFFRAAEPPAHDEWELTDDLRDNYQRGSGQRINELREAVTRQLREVIEPPESGNEEGPPELMRLLRIGKPEARAPAATIRRAKTEFAEKAWRVEAEVWVTDRLKPWHVAPRLQLVLESGSAIRLPWKSLEALQGTVEKSGDGFMVPAGARTFRFSGVSLESARGIEAARCRAVLDLRIEEQ